MIAKSTKTIIATAAKAAGVSSERIAAALAMLDEKDPAPAATRPVAIRQARVCELLDCSRFHVRKLQRLGLLKTVDLAGLKRYPMAEVLKLVGGEHD